MRYKMISCEVFSRPAYRAAADSKNIVDIEFTKLRSHVDPNSLRQEIQKMIDSTPEQYDAVLLGFGLCGNSTAGLKARTQPLVIPRAHDCCTIFLGSRAGFLEHFGQTPSAQWYSACYYERLGGWYSEFSAGTTMPGMTIPGMDGSYSELVEKYGEENAQYIMEMLRGKDDIDFLTYIDLPGYDDQSIREGFIEHARKSGKNTRFIEGSSRLLENMINGDWADEEFLIVPPGAEVKAIYDHDRIIGI